MAKLRNTGGELCLGGHRFPKGQFEVSDSDFDKLKEQMIEGKNGRVCYVDALISCGRLEVLSASSSASAPTPPAPPPLQEESAPLEEEKPKKPARKRRARKKKA